MIDQNRDGFIDKEDLHDMLASLGNTGGDIVQDKTHTEAAVRESSRLISKSPESMTAIAEYTRIQCWAVRAERPCLLAKTLSYIYF